MLVDQDAACSSNKCVAGCIIPTTRTIYRNRGHPVARGRTGKAIGDRRKGDEARRGYSASIADRILWRRLAHEHNCTSR